MTFFYRVSVVAGCVLAVWMAVGCSSSNETAPPAGEPSLAVIHVADPAMAAAGMRVFEEGELLVGVIPPLALRNLYLSWSDDLGALYVNYTDEEAYWSSFDERYGTLPSPFEGARYPAGFGIASNGMIGIDCLLCHAGPMAGKTVVGLANNRLDLRALVEDLQGLPDAIAALKLRDDIPAAYQPLVDSIPDTQVPASFASLSVATGASGSTDGIGLGLITSAEYGDPPADLRTFTGYQDPAPWWTIRHKDRLYSDGAATTDGIYTMMSTLLAFGLDFNELAAYLPTFDAIREMQCALESPRWDDFALPPIDTALAATGGELFEMHCASCHGSYAGGVFPNHVVLAADAGTDRLRTDNFGPTEVAWFNSFIPDPKGEMTDTDGYLAPALAGVWASAPYLHNGSVPTLRAVLDATARPPVWRRSSDAFDAVDVGLTFEVVPAPANRDTAEARQIVDASVPGLGNAGHPGPVLVGQEIDAVLEYLKRL